VLHRKLTRSVPAAHYDSRGRDRTSLTETAPGANDDGSGLAMLFELAAVIRDFEATFEHSIMIVCFGAEEQGLVGSRALAARLSEDDVDVIAMYAADMIGYRVPGGAPDRAGPNFMGLARFSY
jgi:Zn-dependent M28 family amino/carboxypeptidase